jgi:hypothetical protein
MDPEELVEEFFMAPHLPANTHEEWLLRMCAQLMDREARAVRFLEAQQQQAPPPQGRTRRGRRGGGGSSCTSSQASTAPPTSTGTTSWGDC